MKARTVTEENEDAREKRNNKIASLKGLARAEEDSTCVTLEEKLALNVSSTTRDDEIDYSGYRASKRAGAEIRLEVAVSVSQQQQEQSQQQQQQQQQQQVTQTQQIRAPAQKDFPLYPGYKNLISIQKFNHGNKFDLKAFLATYGTSVYEKLTKLAGNHDSQYGVIGYITLSAAKEMAKADFLNQFYSGVYLDPEHPDDYLPDGFYLSMTEGERHLPVAPEPPAAKADPFVGSVKEKHYDRREFPRLVLDYKADLKNQKKHPFRMNLLPKPKACEIIGSPDQFGVSGGTKYSFRLFMRYEGMTIPNFHDIDRVKTHFYKILRNMNQSAADTMIKKLGGWINYVVAINLFSIDNITLENIEKCVNNIQAAALKSNQARRNEFYNYMAGDNKVLAKQLIASHKDIFEISSNNDYAGLFDILFTAGCEGLEIFLGKLQLLYNLDKGETYYHFRHSFLLTSPNWAEYLDNKPLEVFNKIADLTPIQISWWNALSSRHILFCGWADLTDLFATFECFWNEYRRIGTESMGADHFIELAAIYPLGATGNMKVVLPRLLTIMANARDFQEQAECLQGLNFNSNDVMYASVHQDYSLLTYDMIIDGYKTTEAEKAMKENKVADSDMRVSFEEIIQRLGSSLLTPLLFKFVGIQDYSATYQQYADIKNFIYVTYDNKPIYKLTYDISCCNKLAFILFAGSTNERGYACNLRDQLQRFYPFFEQYYTYQIAEIFNTLIRLMSSARWMGLADLVTVGKIDFKISDVQQKFLSAQLIDLKAELMEHVLVYDQNPVALDPATYVSCLFKLNEEESDPQIKIKLPRIFSLIDNKDFKLDSSKELITLLKQFKKKYGKHAYNELIDILSILKLKDTALPRPTMHDTLTAIRCIDKSSDLSVQQYISRSLPKNTTYNPADCRSVLLKPLGVGEVLKAFELSARGVGKKVDTKELNGDNGLNYIVSLIENEPDLIWKDLATKFIIKIQEEHRSKHIVRLELSEQGEQRILLAIVHTIFCPGPFKDIADSIVPMLEYTQQVANFIDALIAIQAKWPDDLSELLVQICGDPSVKRDSIKFLNDFLGQVTKTFSKKLPFPSDFFALLLEHEKQHGIKPELLAIDTIFAAKALTREHKMLILKMNLAAAVMNVSAVNFIERIINYYGEFSGIFTRLLATIENCRGDRLAVFDKTLSLFDLLVEINLSSLTEHMFSLFEHNPTAYLGILQCLFTIIPEPEKAAEKIVIKSLASLREESQEQESTPEAEEPELKMTARHIITRLVFQCCDSSQFIETDVNNIIGRLTYESEAVLSALIDMRPAPTFKTLQIVLSNNHCKPFLANPADPLYCYRFLDQQFDVGRVVSAIEELKNLQSGKVLTYLERQKILQQFLLINRFGYHPGSPVYLREQEGSITKELTCKDLTAAEMRHLVARCRAVYNDPLAKAEDRDNARLIFIAIVREAVWCVTTNFPYSTQILPILIAFMHNDSVLGEIDTGEGKAMIMAMVVANLWFEGRESSRGAVNFATSTLELAQVGFEEFSPMFDLLGIPRSGKVVTSQTSVTEFCYNGINYSAAAQLSLFIAKQKLDAYYIKHYQDAPLSLALDEADHTLYYDDTHYRYATPLHQTDLIYIFPVLYQLIHSEKFKDEKSTIENDIIMARQLLIDAAQQKEKDQDYIAKLSDRQIDTWLESAIAAKQLKENIHFVVRTESRGAGEDAYHVSFARILSNSRVSEGAEWSNGVHQFLHTRLNEERVTKQRKIPEFPLDPETAPIASISSKNMIQHHMDRGRLFGVTGTAGSREEISELTAQSIRSFRIPPHRPNRREIEPPQLACGQDNHFTLIMQVILRHLRQGKFSYVWGLEINSKPQPLLICFRDIAKSQAFYDHLLLHLDKLGGYKSVITPLLLNGSRTMMNNADVVMAEKDFLSKSGVAGSIVVSTMLDRGSDFKPRLHEADIRQNHPFGLGVIQTFVASESQSRQIAGRAARQGYIGQYALVVDQEEFNELLDPSGRGINAIAKLQQERALNERSRRCFGERLGAVKNHFFSKYIDFAQVEKNMTPDINRKWAECLNNMDLEWHRLIMLYRQKKKLNEREALAKCTADLIRKACKDWNFLVPWDEHFMLRPIEVEALLLKPSVSPAEPAPSEADPKSTLDINDVSPAKYYIEHCPLYMTLDPKDNNDIESIRARVEGKRLAATYECIGQILEETLDTHRLEDSLSYAFNRLITRVYASRETIPFRKRLEDIYAHGQWGDLIKLQNNNGRGIPIRKKLVEIYALAQWSEQAELQETISRILLKAFFDFAMSKLFGMNITIDRETLDHPGLLKEALDVEALLVSLRNAYAEKFEERQAEIEKMNMAQYAVDKAYNFLFATDSIIAVLGNLIEIIDHPFTRIPEKLSPVLMEARTSELYRGSWCTLFRRRGETEETTSPLPERVSDFVLV